MNTASTSSPVTSKAADKVERLVPQHFLSPEAIDAMIDTARVAPAHLSRDYSRAMNDSELTLTGFNDPVPDGAEKKVSIYSQALAVAFQKGLDPQCLSSDARTDRSAQFWLTLSAEAMDAMIGNGVMRVGDGPSHMNHYLSIDGDGKMRAHYQRILARSREFGCLSAEQMNRLVESLSTQLVNRNHLLKDGSKSNASAPKELVGVGGAAATTQADQGDKSQDLRRADLAKQAAAIKPLPKAVADQLSTLSVRGNALLLPDQHLSEYAQIKKLLIQAGGKYVSQGDLRFEFPAGLVAGDVLAQLLGGVKMNVQQETQFFETPDDVIARALDELGDVRGLDVLEPSAGRGAMANALKEQGAQVWVIENWRVNVLALQQQGYDVLDADFLKVSPHDLGSFDAVMMNPPFTKSQDQSHVRHALGFLKPEGELVAIMSRSFEGSSVAKSKNFRELLDLAQANVQVIEAGAFKASGTGISTCMVHIQMERLLKNLALSGRSATEFGLDLSAVQAQEAHRTAKAGARP